MKTLVTNKERVQALAKLLEVKKKEIVQSEYDENMFIYEDQEYLVVTDAEADELWEKELDYYLDELILPELPKNLQFYFDGEKWKNDARYDGRGHSLAKYDGHENYEEVKGETFYIYRVN